MTENLRLVFSGDYVGKYNSSSNTITATTTQLTPTNSDVTTTWPPSHVTQTATGTKWSAASTPTQTEVNTPYSYTKSDVIQDLDGDTQSIGSLYNWYSATAGTGTYSTTDSGLASSSICPKGFQLPSTNNSTRARWVSLIQTTYGYSSSTSDEAKYNAIQKFPFSIIKTGYYQGSVGNMSGTGSANLWQAQAYAVQGNNTDAYILRLASTVFTNWYNGMNKANGSSIRCVSKR